MPDPVGTGHTTPALRDRRPRFGLGRGVPDTGGWGDGLAIHPGVEGASAGGKPPDAGVVAFGLAPTGQLHDDGAELRGPQERQDLLLPGRLRGGPGRAGDPHVVPLVEELPRGEFGIPPDAGARGVRDPEKVADRFAYYLRRNPHDGRYFGVRVGRYGGADPGELTRAAACLVMIRIQLGEPYLWVWQRAG
jgi:hypothetical protein